MNAQEGKRGRSAGTAATRQPAKAEKSIAKARLIREARRWLGVAPHVAAGALHEAEDELTVSEAKRYLAAFGVEV